MENQSRMNEWMNDWREAVLSGLTAYRESGVGYSNLFIGAVIVAWRLMSWHMRGRLRKAKWKLNIAQIEIIYKFFDSQCIVSDLANSKDWLLIYRW
jgi:hypothetical protein